jgi:hypothetical protein
VSNHFSSASSVLGEEDDEKQAEINDDNNDDELDSWDAKIRGEISSQTSLDFNLDLGKLFTSNKTKNPLFKPKI